MLNGKRISSFYLCNKFLSLHWIVDINDSHNCVNNSNICLLFPPTGVEDLWPSEKFLEVLRACLSHAPEELYFP